MFSKRSITTTALVAAMSIGAGAAVMAPSTATAGDCSGKATTAQIKAACKKGGVKEAKSVMKAAVKKAKDAGKDWKCKTCHEDQKTYAVKKDAPDIKPYL